MHVLVVNPFRNQTFRNAISTAYPLGEPWDSPIFTLAAVIREAGIDVTCLALQGIFESWNDGRDTQSLEQLIEEESADIILIATDNWIPSRSTATLPGISIIAETAKRLHPKTQVVVCGRIATVLGSELLRHAPAVDYYIRGEAEEHIVTVLKHIDHGRTGLAGDDPPLTFLGNHASVADGLATTDMGALPPPAWDLLPRSIAVRNQLPGRSKAGPVVTMRTSAGCAFRCKFCAGVPRWTDPHFRNAESVAAELRLLQDTFGDDLRIAFFEDELFTRSLEHLTSVRDTFVAAGIRVHGAYTHSHYLTESSAPILADFVDRIYMGLDSGNDEQLRKLGKGQSLATVLQATEIAHTSGLDVHLEWIIGTPYQDSSDLAQDICRIALLLRYRIVESINTYVYCPHPGTEFAVNASRYKMELSGAECEGFNMQESGGYPAFSAQFLTPQQIYVAYLISQIVINELQNDLGIDPGSEGLSSSDPALLESILQRFS